MTTEEKTTALTELFELIPVCQKLLFHSIELREDGLTRSQFYILLSLRRHPYLTMGQIASGLACPREQATRSLAPLVEQGLVERYIDESNRKLVPVRLTQAGLDYLQSKKQLLLENLQAGYAELPEAEIAQFQQAVDTIKQVLGRLDGGCAEEKR